ncbi:MAG: alpha/beta fold hydrolase [Vicinamibacterales bacterium]|nr:alpha/beta fold hydrolase [Vicinamibacterales bacterium]
MQVFYLHGFASSPRSSKAEFFTERLKARGALVHVPDFNEPDFSTLTMSRMLRQLEAGIAEIPPGPVVLIGSSLGGFLAVEAAARSAGRTSHPIDRVILLAPAVELEWDRWTEIAKSGGVNAWRRNGEIEIFHYGDAAPRRLRFAFYEDAQQYNAASRRLKQPVLIFQGRLDESVNPALVEKFSRAQPNAELHLLEDGHQLKESLEVIWRETARFLDVTSGF